MELHADMEGEEGPWEGMVMDDAEAVLLEEPSQDARSLREDPEERLRPDEKEPNQDDNNTGQEPEERPQVAEERHPEESPAPRRRWAHLLDAANLGSCRGRSESKMKCRRSQRRQHWRLNKSTRQWRRWALHRT